MIVVSGVLVLIALVLLILGFVVAIGFTYAAIGCAAVAAVLVLIDYVRWPARGSGRPAPAPTQSAHDNDEEDRSRRAPQVDRVDGVDQAHGEGGNDEAALGLGSARCGPGDDGGFPQETAPAAVAAEQPSGSVFVVPGRPHFHAQRCPAVGHEASGEPDSVGDIDELDLAQAQARGFTPCEVCRPLAAFEAAAEAKAQPPASRSQ